MKLLHKKSFWVLMVFFWMGIIFWFSNQPSEESTDISVSFIDKLLQILPHPISEQQKAQLVMFLFVPIRKLAHVSIYTCGGILLMLLFSLFNLKKWKQITFTLIIGITYACTDEFHQLFVQGRSAEVTDILIDIAGVMLGIGIFVLIKAIVKKISNKKNKGENR